MPDGMIICTATSAKSGSVVTATINGIDVSVQVARDTPVAAGDVLGVIRSGSQWFCVSRFFAAAPAGVTPAPPPNPKPATVSGKLVVLPVSTGSYRDGAWRTDNTDVAQGTYGGTGNSTGGVFYGDKPRSLTGATVTDAWINVRRGQGGAFPATATTLRLATESVRPAGAPTMTSTTTGPALPVNGSQAAFTIPVAYAQAMVDGTAGGLALFDATGAPYVRLTGRGDYSSAFALTIVWKR